MREVLSSAEEESNQILDTLLAELDGFTSQVKNRLRESVKYILSVQFNGEKGNPRDFLETMTGTLMSCESHWKGERAAKVRSLRGKVRSLFLEITDEDFSEVEAVIERVMLKLTVLKGLLPKEKVKKSEQVFDPEGRFNRTFAKKK